MKTRMTSAQAARFFSSYARRLQKNVAAAERESAKELLKAAHAQASGSLSTRELRRMRHPYARAKGRWNSPIDPAKVNRQSGEMDGGFRILPMQASRRGTRTGVTNATRHARLIKGGGKGKSKMVARPLAHAILLEIRAARRARLRAALAQTLKERP